MSTEQLSSATTAALPSGQPAPREAASEPVRYRRRRIKSGDVAGRFGILVIWAVLIVLFGIIDAPKFFQTSTFQTIFASQSVLLIIALALMIPQAVGEFDLSVVGTTSVSMMIVGVLDVQHHMSMPLVVTIAFVSGIVIGAINAFFVIVVGVDSIVVTLGSGTLWAGIAYALGSTTIPGISMGLVNAVTYQIWGLPLSFYYAVVLTIVIWYVMSHTPLGRYMYFVGANRSVSLLSGLPVRNIRAGSLVVSGFIAAGAGVVMAGTIGSASADVSASYLLPAFAAVFLGTTAISIGRFNAWGTFIAVYFLITGITGLELHGLSGWIEDVFYGGSLVLAVAVSKLAAKRLGRSAAA